MAVGHVLALNATSIVITGQDATLTKGVGTSAVFPAPEDVRFGIQYGPTGVEYTGTMAETSLKYWNGSSWQLARLKSWNGSAWV